MPGPKPAGTRFVATAVYPRQSYGAATWGGRVQAVTAPRLLGRPGLNGVVTPVAGRWTGGWGGEPDQLGVEACATPSGHGCRMPGGGELGCPDGSSRPRIGGRSRSAIAAPAPFTG